MTQTAYKPTALVVGGSGGVGSAIAAQLAAEGQHVALSYLSGQDRAQRVADAIIAQGGSASIHRLDASDSAQVGAVIDAVAADNGLQTLVYAAGPLVPQIYLSQTTPEQMRRHLIDDSLGFFTLCHHALPHLRRAKGSIVAVQSAAQYRWCPADGLSVAPKAAVNAMMTGFAKEEGRFGVRANGVALGIIATGSFDQLKAQGHISPAYLEAAVANTPLRGFGSAQDVAEAVCWLASAKAKFVTGQVICVDGGFHI